LKEQGIEIPQSRKGLSRARGYNNWDVSLCFGCRVWQKYKPLWLLDRAGDRSC
jgi:hypothetical protein